MDNLLFKNISSTFLFDSAFKASSHRLLSFMNRSNSSVPIIAVLGILTTIFSKLSFIPDCTIMSLAKARPRAFPPKDPPHIL